MSLLDSAIHLMSRRPVRAAMRPLMAGRATIFMLHRLSQPERHIGGHSVEFIRHAVAALRNSGAEIVSLRRIIEAYSQGNEPDPNWVAFTIDDGFADQAELLRSAFLPLQCPVTVFLISGLIDGQLWPWDDQLAYVFQTTQLQSVRLALPGRTFQFSLQSDADRKAAAGQVRDYCKTVSNSSLYETVNEIAAAAQVVVPHDPPPEFRPMSWQQIRELETLGIEFAPHSVTHRIFSQLSADEVREEISVSWRRLREELRNTVPIVAWPTGEEPHFSAREEGIAAELGLIGSVATGSDYAFVSRKRRTPGALPSLRRFGLPDNIRDVLQYGSAIERLKQIVRGVRDPLVMATLTVLPALNSLVTLGDLA